jgi:hydroxyacylglutathione hydrolase
LEFEQFYLACLSHASYLVGDGGEAAIVDPQRDVDPYLDAARARGLTIRWVLETHLHADFVSGHRELAERTGATIVLGARARATFPHRAVEDGDVIEVGRVRLTVLATPGHTPESVCYRIDDPDAPGDAPRLLTGDTLFVGDVGRPDLVTSKGYTASDMAGMLHDSLHARVLPLPDDTTVWPAHGPGSACGRNIGRELHTTLGRERRMNPNLAPMTRDEFVRHVTTDLAPAPAYFGFDAETNRAGAPALKDLPAPPPLSPADAERAVALGALFLDVRPDIEFCAGHVPGSVHVAMTGQFAPWAAAVVPHGSRIVLVANDVDEVGEARLRLARVGLDAVEGYLDGGLAAWVRAGRPASDVMGAEPTELGDVAGRGARVVDVRRAGEFAQGHVPGATLGPLEAAARIARGDGPRLREAFGLPADDDGGAVALVCQSGYRSTIAASLLRPFVRGPLVNLFGGTGAWAAAGLPLEGPGAQART